MRIRRTRAIGKEMGRVSKQFFTDGDNYFSQFESIYSSWFPDKAFTLKNFKTLPQDIAAEIMKALAQKTIGIILSEALETFKEHSKGHDAFVIVSHCIKRLMQTYRLDSIDIEEEMEARGFSEEQKQRGRMLLI